MGELIGLPPPDYDLYKPAKIIARDDCAGEAIVQQGRRRFLVDISWDWEPIRVTASEAADLAFGEMSDTDPPIRRARTPLRDVISQLKEAHQKTGCEITTLVPLAGVN